MLHTQPDTHEARLSAPAGVPVSPLLESIKFVHFYQAFPSAYISVFGGMGVIGENMKAEGVKTGQ